MGAALDLILGDLDERRRSRRRAGVSLALRDPWELTRSPTRVGVGCWTRSVAVIIEETCGARRGRARGAGTRPGRALGERADVLGRGSAAAADDADAVALDELAERLGERARLLREDRLAVRALLRDAGVRDAVDRDGEHAHRGSGSRRACPRARSSS